MKSFKKASFSSLYFLPFIPEDPILDSQTFWHMSLEKKIENLKEEVLQLIVQKNKFDYNVDRKHANNLVSELKSFKISYTAPDIMVR